MSDAPSMLSPAERLAAPSRAERVAWGIVVPALGVMAYGAWAMLSDRSPGSVIGMLAFFFAAFFALNAAIVALFVRSRRRPMARMLAGEETLARWRATPAEFAAVSEVAPRPRLGWVIGGSLTVGGFALLNYGLKDAVLAGAIVLTLLLCIVGGVWAVRSLSVPELAGEVWIGRRALCVNGVIVAWTMGTRLDAVRVARGEPMALVFALSTRGRSGRVHYEQRVPVPRAHEREAEAVCAKLRGRSG